MQFLLSTLIIALSALPFAAQASPAGLDVLESRQAVDNIVYVTDANKFWYITLSSHTSMLY